MFKQYKNLIDNAIHNEDSSNKEFHTKKNKLTLEIKQFLLNELDQQVQSLPDNYITAKRKLREDYNPQILSINSELLDLKKEVGKLKTNLVETGVDVGPAVYLARAFNTDIDTVVKFFMFILIFVFDHSQ